MMSPAFSFNMLGMKRVLLLTVVVFASLLAGCVPQESFFPLCTKEDTLFDKRLLGEWQTFSGTALKQGDKSSLIIFSVGDLANTYDVKSPDSPAGMTTFSVARLVKLGKYIFIDFGTPDLSKMPQIPYPALECHVFGRLTFEKDKVQIDFLNDDWVKDQAKSGKLGLAFVQSSNIVLSAPTADLRKFAQEHAEDLGAFSETYTLARKN
jgi:hypothetical protein